MVNQNTGDSVSRNVHHIVDIRKAAGCNLSGAHSYRNNPGFGEGHRKVIKPDFQTIRVHYNLTSGRQTIDKQGTCCLNNTSATTLATRTSSAVFSQPCNISEEGCKLVRNTGKGSFNRDCLLRILEETGNLGLNATSVGRTISQELTLRVIVFFDFRHIINQLCMNQCQLFHKLQCQRQKPHVESWAGPQHV